MVEGRSINAVISDLEKQQKVKADYIASARDMQMMEDGSTFSITHRKTGEVKDYSSTTLLHRQIGNALKIPAQYYDMMRERKPELLAQNINTWLDERSSDRFMLRTFEYEESQVGRALLSSQYRRIDNILIAEAVLPLFAGNPDYEVVSCEITERKLYFQIVNHRLTKKIRVGDAVQGGVVITNSEVGLGAVNICPFIYRLVCTNGMIVKEMKQKRAHIGARLGSEEDGFEMISNETVQAEDWALALKLRDYAKIAVDESRFETVVSRLKKSAEVPLTGDPGDVVKLTSKIYDMSRTEQTGILRHLVEGGDLSKYGLSNAITRTSNDIENYDRAVELEEIGWEVANMQDDMWTQVNGKGYLL